MATSSTITPVTPRKKMPAEVFVKIWKGEMGVANTRWSEVVTSILYSRIVFHNIEVDQPIRMLAFDNNLPDIILVNCKISNLEIEKSQKKITLNIEAKSRIGNIIIDSVAEEATDKDCNILTVKESNVKKITIIASPFSEINIENSKIENIFLGKGSKIEWGFKIENKSKIGEISITGQTNINNFFAYKSIVNGINLQDSKINRFNVGNSNFGDFIINSSEIGDVAIGLNSIFANIDIGNISSIGFCSIFQVQIESLRISKSISEGAFISESKIREIQIIESTTLSYSILVSDINKIFCAESKVLGFRIIDTNLNALYVQPNCAISSIKIKFTLNNAVLIYFNKSDIAQIDLSDTVLLEMTAINITDCRINNLAIKNACCYGSIFLNHLKPLTEWEEFQNSDQGFPIMQNGGFEFSKTVKPSIISLAESDLGKIQFFNCDLQKFDRFEFLNTKILDAFLAQSQMPSDNAFYLQNDEYDPKKIAEQKRLAYGQFKKIYEIQGNLAGSLHYLAYEMDAYREQLMQEKTRPRFSKKWWKEKKSWDNRGERATLWLNKISTNYGNNWLRGLIMTLLMMSICFTIFCWMLGYRPGNDWGKFGELVSFAPYYLNPLRDLDSVSMINENKEVPIEWYARLWDFISRIIVAYFAYQTIQAFRKLGKSSG